MSKEAFAPGGFYSPVVDPVSARRYLRSAQFSRQAARVDAMLDLPAMLALWEKIAPKIVAFPFEKTPGFRYHGRNGQFEYYDASILSGMIAHVNPRRIIEIGAGYSSVAMFDTVERLKRPRLESFLTIDPDLSRIRKLDPPAQIEMLAAEVQSVPLERFEALEEGDILFIDSSHVMKTASDVHYEYLYILPRLKPGVVVHIHDIFYPFEYPRRWLVHDRRSWNEVYLVDTMLTYGKSFGILFFNDAMLKKAADRMRAPDDMFHRFEGFPTRPIHAINGSLWLVRR